jgi:RimJ/RimL family protein N-acetyltransferase
MIEGLVIRPVGAGDYERVAAVLDGAYPDARMSPADLRVADEAIRASGLVSDRLIAEVDGAPVGYVVHGHLDWSADEHVWIVGVRVIPEMRRRGIGTALHDEVVQRALGGGIDRFFAEVDESLPGGVAFAQRLGYEQIGFGFESWIDVGEPDPADAARHRGRADPDEGIVVATLAELQVSVPEWFERLHRLYSEIEADVPSPFPVRPVPAITFRQRHVESAAVIPEAFFIALEGDEWVGLTELRKIEREPSWLQQELTGVVPSHRRRGLATRLKRIGLAWAALNGYRRIRTSNDGTNEGMLAVNDALGYERGATEGHWLLRL